MYSLFHFIYFNWSFKVCSDSKDELLQVSECNLNDCPIESTPTVLHPLTPPLPPHLLPLALFLQSQHLLSALKRPCTAAK